MRKSTGAMRFGCDIERTPPTRADMNNPGSDICSP